MVNIFFGKQNIYTWQQPPPTWISKRLRFPLKPLKVCHSVGIHARFIEVGKPNVQKITMMKNPILTWLSAFKITPSTFWSALFNPNLVVGAIWIYFIFKWKIKWRSRIWPGTVFKKWLLEWEIFQNAQKVLEVGGGCVLLLPVMRVLWSWESAGKDWLSPLWYLRLGRFLPDLSWQSVCAPSINEHRMSWKSSQPDEIKDFGRS